MRAKNNYRNLFYAMAAPTVFFIILSLISPAKPKYFLGELVSDGYCSGTVIGVDKRGNEFYYRVNAICGKSYSAFVWVAESELTKDFK